MKLKDFMQDSNALRKGSVKIPVEGMIGSYRKSYKRDLEKGLTFQHEVYAITPGGKLMVHVKVPSGTVKDFYYDVLLEFSGESTTTKFEDCEVKVFSNSPSFVYSYAYVFYHLDPNPTVNSKTKSKTGMMIDMFKHKIPRDRLLMPGTEKKLGEDVLSNAPVVRNPFGLPLFDKSIYYAIFYINDTLTYQDALRTRKYRSASQVIANVADFNALMAKRKHLHAKQREANRKKMQADAARFKKAEAEVRRANSISSTKKPMSATRAKTASKPKGMGTVRRIGGK